MTPLFKKLNYKNQPTIIAINAPKSMDAELEAMSECALVITNLKKIKSISFIICFATQQKEVDDITKQIHLLLAPDAVIWFCYPKGTSKKYTCDFNRDTGWAVLGSLGMEPVRAVAIDEDWSALRFKEAKYIKTITRRSTFAISEEGKTRGKK